MEVLESEKLNSTYSSFIFSGIILGKSCLLLLNPRDYLNIIYSFL